MSARTASSAGWLPVVRGTYTSHTFTFALDSAAVAAMLPPGLALAAQTITPPGTHPVLLMMGKQQDVHVEWSVLRGPGVTYDELFLGIPFVNRVTREGKCPGPFMFAPLLYVDRFLPFVMGYFWGFAKQDVTIVADAMHFAVRDSRGPLLTAEFAAQGSWGPPSSFPNFQAYPSIFQQTGIGRTLLGFYVCFVFRHNSIEQAEVRSAATTVEILRAFVPGLAAGTYRSQGIASEPLGSFQMTNSWTLDPPSCCS
jgi:hypothetical protein